MLPDLRFSYPVWLACHAVRLAAFGWLAWTLGQLLLVWRDPVSLARAYSWRAAHELAPVDPLAYYLSLGVVLADWLITALLVFRVWQLFGRYLSGHIFDRLAVTALRGLGWTALAAVLVDIAARPLVFALVSGGGLSFWGRPDDLLYGSMALFLIVMAEVFTAGTAIAEDNRQIV